MLCKAYRGSGADCSGMRSPLRSQRGTGMTILDPVWRSPSYVPRPLNTALTEAVTLTHLTGVHPKKLTFQIPAPTHSTNKYCL